MRRSMRRTAIVSALGSLLLSACPGNLDRPERFYKDAGDCTDVQNKIFIPTCGGSGCHENPGAAGNLDLSSAGVAGRINSQLSTCMGKPMKSYLFEKLGPNPACGAKMPLGSDALSANELKCVRDYLARIADGGV